MHYYIIDIKQNKVYSTRLTVWGIMHCFILDKLCTDAHRIAQYQNPNCQTFDQFRDAHGIPLMYAKEYLQDKEPFYILSPDGFSLYPGKTYTNMIDAYEDFTRWKKRFSEQGYYSSPKYGKINLYELENYLFISDIPYLK